MSDLMSPLMGASVRRGHLPTTATLTLMTPHVLCLDLTMAPHLRAIPLTLIHYQTALIVKKMMILQHLDQQLPFSNHKQQPQSVQLYSVLSRMQQSLKSRQRTLEQTLSLNKTMQMDLQQPHWKQSHQLQHLQP